MCEYGLLYFVLVDFAHCTNNPIMALTVHDINIVDQTTKELIYVVSHYPDCKLTSLETPVYSIHDWNKIKNHKTYLKNKTLLSLHK